MLCMQQDQDPQVSSMTSIKNVPLDTEGHLGEKKIGNQNVNAIFLDIVTLKICSQESVQVLVGNTFEIYTFLLQWIG